MGSVQFSRSLVASLILMIFMHTFFHNIHALQNRTTPSYMTSPFRGILRVGVPWKTAFTEFVLVEKNGTNFIVEGFCVKVFEAAIKTLNYSIHYIPVRNGITEPSYDHDLLRKILLKEVDAVVGDVTIIANRAHDVLFTQPFIDAGLLVVVPQVKDHISLGFDLLKPFTAGTWVLILGFFFTGGLTVYLLERRNNPQLQGHPRRQFGRIVWISFSTWFTNQDDIKTVLGRIVLIAWLLVTGILYSCYTANLSAILTAPRLQPTLNDIHSVVTSQVNIGFQNGSYAEEFLREYFKIDEQRLRPLNREAEYYKALYSGEVGAIIGERHYMQTLVAKDCNKLTFAGQTFTSQNWGFAFDPMHDQLVKEISMRILELSDDGTLHTIQKQWVPSHKKDCGGYIPSGSGQLDVYQLWDLFVVSGLVSLIVLLLYMMLYMMRRKWIVSIVDRHAPPQRSSGHDGGLEFQFRITKSLDTISGRRASI